MILLPRLASQIQKNPQRHKIIYVIHLIGCKDQLINLKLFSVGYPVRAISVAVLTKDPGTHWFWTGTQDFHFSQEESQDSP